MIKTNGMLTRKMKKRLDNLKDIVKQSTARAWRFMKEDYRDLTIKELYAGCLNTSIACQLAGGAVGKPKDIIFGDNLLDHVVQRQTLRELDLEDPYLTVVSFPCDPWTSMSNMFSPELRDAKREGGMIHLVVRLLRIAAAEESTCW